MSNAQGFINKALPQSRAFDLGQTEAGQVQGCRWGIGR